MGVAQEGMEVQEEAAVDMRYQMGSKDKIGYFFLHSNKFLFSLHQFQKDCFTLFK